MGLRRFHLDLPSDWQDRTVYAFDAPPADGRRTQLVLECAPASGQSLDTFAAVRIARTKAALGNAEVVREGPLDLGEGRSAIQFDYRYWADGIAQYGREVFVAHAGRLYAFSASFDAVTRPVHSAPVEKIVASLAEAPTAG